MRSSLHPTQSTQRGRQRGQALAEFTIAAAFVLIPLFLMIPLLGKFMDMKATTIQAARYAAWERTAWYGTDKTSDNFEANLKSDGAIRSEVQQRFFADSATAPLRNTAQTLPGAVAAKPLWHDHTGASMLSTYSAGTGPGTQTPGTTDVFLNGVKNIANTIGIVFGTEFRLDMNSLYTSTVSLDAANTPAIRQATGADSSGFTAPNFAMEQMLVANGWSANGPDFVNKQTEALAMLTLGRRSPVSGVLHYVQSLAGTFVKELGTDSLKLGGVLKPDLVPPDRLTASTAPARPPRQTAEQRRKEESDRQLAEAKALTDRITNKANAFHDAIGATQNTINSCKADKQEEFQANVEECRFGKDLICNWHSGTGWWCGISRLDKSALNCTPKDPPGGPGTSYTPNADASVPCHEGLDAKIADLQAKLADPDLQRGITESDDQLQKNSDLNNDAVFMERRRAAYAKIAELQAQIDNLKSQKNAL